MIMIGNSPNGFRFAPRLLAIYNSRIKNLGLLALSIWLLIAGGEKSSPRQKSK